MIHNKTRRLLALMCTTVLLFAGCTGGGSGSGSSSGNQSFGSLPSLPTPTPTPASTPAPTPTPTPAPGAPAKNTWTSSCGNIPGVTGGKYCIYDNSSNPQSTIWFFHGLQDSESVLQDPAATSPSYQTLMDYLPPTRIVQMSLGTSWLLTQYAGRTLPPLNSTMEMFSTQAVPFFESLGLPKPYIAMGHSMGGFNTSSLCATFPDMWSKCVLINAMLPSCDPFSPFPMCNPMPGMIVDDHFTQAAWNSTQPMVLLSNTAKLPKSYVTACALDEFGLYNGPKAWADAGKARGFNVTWSGVATGCDHSNFPAQEIVDFVKSN